MILDETNTFANAIYIYLIILFTGILAGSLFALFKEYMSAPRSVDIEKALDSKSDIDGKTFPSNKALNNSDSLSGAASCSPEPERSAKSCLGRFRSKKSSTSRPSRQTEEHTTVQNAVPEVKSDVFIDSSKSRKYTFEELTQLQIHVTQLPNPTGKIKLSTLLCMQIPISSSKVEGHLGKSDLTRELRENIDGTCMASSSIALFRLVCMGSFVSPFSNKVHFRQDFCELMTYLIDSLAIYSNSRTQPLIQLSLVDVAACFAWEHWNSKWCAMMPPAAKSGQAGPEQMDASTPAPQPDHTEFVNENFEHDYTGLATSILNDQEGAFVLPDVVTFRLLCNLYLGSPAIAKSVRAYSVYKLSAIFHACASRTQCGQHHELIAILAQAVASAERDSLKAFFYELLIDLLRPHIFCCVESENLFASESPIYELIFKGLWTDQAPQVKEKALKAVHLLGEKFADVKSWLKYMKQTNASTDLGLGHVGAPGSWSEYNCD